MAKKSLVTNAAVLAVAGIFVKVLGAFFRIPLANWIGSRGMANYSPAYSLYAVLLVISTSGIPIAISRMVAERYAIGEYSEADRVFRISRLLMTGLGILGFVVVFFFAEPIAAFMNLEGSALSMKATAFALLIVPIMASYRGYFQGQQEMTPTALSQIVEQLFRVGIGLTLAWVLMHGSLFAGHYNEGARGAAGGCFGASAGAIGGLAVMLIIYGLSRKELRERIQSSISEHKEAAGSILKSIFVIAIPITIGAMIMPLVNLIDATIVNRRLVASGWEADVAEDIYGQLVGFAEPIVAFPQVIMVAIVMSIVPMVAAANKIKDQEGLQRTISLGMRMATMIGFPCAVGLCILSKPALLMLYFTQRESAENATLTLQVLSISFIFLALITIMNGILQGIGKQNYPVVNLAIGVAVKIVVTWVLVAIPAINVVGAPIGTMVAYIIAAGLDFGCIKKFAKVKIPFNLTVTKPLISTIVMGVFVAITSMLLYHVTDSNGVNALVSIVVGVVVYGIMIVKTKGISREEMMAIKMGHIVVRVCDKLHLW